MPGLLALLALVGCAAEPHAEHGAGMAGSMGARVPAGPLPDPSGSSVYLHVGQWATQRGDSITLGELGGRLQVVAMVYTHCTFACPRILADMKRIEGMLAPEELDDVGFVLVSVDPERDTPGRLATFAEGSALDPDRWTLLSASDDDIRMLSALLGVSYRRLPDGEFEHSNLITLLDPGGVITHRQSGLGADPASLLESLRSRLSEYR